MDVKRIVAELDAEIEKLQHARAAILSLDGVGSYAPVGNNTPPVPRVKTAPRKKVRQYRWSPEARARMSLRMKQRWAARNGKRKAKATAA